MGAGSLWQGNGDRRGGADGRTGVGFAFKVAPLPSAKPLCFANAAWQGHPRSDAARTCTCAARATTHPRLACSRSLTRSPLYTHPILHLLPFLLLPGLPPPTTTTFDPDLSQHDRPGNCRRRHVCPDCRHTVTRLSLLRRRQQHYQLQLPLRRPPQPSLIYRASFSPWHLLSQRPSPHLHEHPALQSPGFPPWIPEHWRL